jgi:serine protease SohB
MVGSIGVIGETFNFKELADKIGVKFFRFKTSEVKGGFPSSTEWTDKDIENTMEDINRTLEQFKNIVTKNRPNINHELAFTAKVWYGKQSIDLGLIDEIGIYDDIIMSFVDTHDIFVVTEKEEDIIHKLFEKIPFSSSFLTDFFQNLTTHNKVKNVIC